MWPLLISLAFGFGGHGSESRQAKALGEAASTYWEGVRWGDAGKASPFLTDLEARVLLTEMLDDGKAKLTGVTVIQVELGAQPKDATPRPAVVLVRLEVIDVTRNRYETVDYIQHWHSAGYSWVIDGVLSPLGTDRPWVVRDAAAPAPTAQAPEAPIAPVPAAQ